MIGDHAAKLLYVQQNQINLQIPAELPGGAAAPVQVVFEGRSSAPVPILISKRKQLSAVEDPAALTEALWSSLQAASWEATAAAWQRQNPDASCRRFQGDGDSTGADQQWCEQCEADAGVRNQRWSFYAFDTVAPGCRLGQFEAVVEGIAEETVQQIYNDLRRQLARKYGPGDEPEAVHARGSASWRQLRRWRSEGAEIYLYVAKPRFEPTHVGLMARAQPLLDALAEDKVLWTVEEHSGLEPGGELDRALTQALGASYPELAGLLAQTPAAGSGPQPQLVYDVLVRLVTEAVSAPRQRQAASLLAADRLADRLNSLFVAPTDSRPQPDDIAAMRRRLAQLGIDYESGGYDSFGNSGKLLRRVWEEYGDTPWGEWAFLTLHLRGWTLGVGCRGGEENFREVVRRGESFVAQRPASPRRWAVQFATAQANETWWSLSQASPEAAGIDAARFRKGSPQARERAMREYRAVISQQPAGAMAAYARRQLPRLELGVDTNQRRFYCMMD